MYSVAASGAGAVCCSAGVAEGVSIAVVASKTCVAPVPESRWAVQLCGRPLRCAELER